MLQLSNELLFQPLPVLELSSLPQRLLVLLLRFSQIPFYNTILTKNKSQNGSYFFQDSSMMRMQLGIISEVIRLMYPAILDEFEK